MKGLSFRAPIARDSVKPLNIYPQKVESSKSSGGNTSLVSRAYYFLTEPNSSRGALRWAVFMLCCVVFNVIILVLESIDGKNNYEGRKDMSTYPNMPAENTYRVIQLILWIPMSIDAVIRIIMTSSVCISEPDLMEEYLEDKFKFALFIFDVLSIIPFVLRYSYLYPRDKDLTAVSRLILKVLDVLSSAKVLRVSKDILSIRAIRIALGRSMRHLVLPFFFFLVFNVFFGVAVYFMEPCYNYESCAWENLFDASFFSVVTMTTTGYGNQVPSYLPSRVVSVIIMLFGSLFMSMPLAIIGNEYANAWENMVLESESSAVTPTASDETSSQRRSGMSIVHQTLTAQSSGTFSQAVTAPMKDSRVGLGKALEKLQELTMQEDSGMSPALVIAFCEVRGWLTPLLSNIRIAICALTDAKVKSDLRRISFMRKSSLTSVPPRKSSIASVPSNVSSVSSLDRGSEIHSQLSDGVRERFKTLRQLDSLVEEDESDIAREQSPREDSKSESVENPRSSNIFGSVLRIAPAYVNRFLTSDTTRSGAVAPADSVKDDADIIPTTQVSAEGLTTVETFEPPEEDNPEECSEEKPDITISNLPTNKNKVELERSYTESTPTDLYSSIMNGESSVVNSKSLSVRGPSSVDGSGQYSKRRQASATEVISPRRISGVKDRFKINPSDVSKPANRSPRRIKREESSTFIIKMAKAAPDIAKMRGDGTEFVRNFDRALKNPSAIRTKVWMLLEFPHSSPGAKALQIFLIILILISVLMLYTQTLPSMYDYGEGTNMCGWVLKAYCTDKHDSSLDPGCFVQDNDGPTSKKLRYFCNDNDCFAHGINYGARYTNMTCANSENLPFQTSDELVYNFRNPEFFVSRKRMHQLHGICTRIECRHDHSQIADGNRGWVPVEIFVNFFFTVEIFLRILVSSSLYGFARDFMNIFDILSVVPFYTDIIRAFRGSGFALDFSILASSPRPMLLVAMKSMSVSMHSVSYCCFVCLL